MRSFLHLSVLFLAGFFALGIYPLSANAQLIPWGVGQYAAMQNCPMDYQVAGGAASRSDKEKKIVREMATIDKKQARSVKAKEKALEKKKAAAKVLYKAFKDSFGTFLVDTHLEAGYSCSIYKGYDDTKFGGPGSIGTIEKADREAHNNEIKDLKGGKVTVPAAFRYEWLKGYCDSSQDGGVFYDVCSDANLRDSDLKRVTSTECKDAISDFRKYKKEYDEALTEANQADKDMKAKEDELDEARDKASEAAEKKQKYGSTEADCEECKRSTDWPGVGANLLAGLVYTYAGSQQDQLRIRTNGQNGFVTNAAPSALTYGYPFMVNAAYGALGGQIGKGGFGCAGSVGGGGYPYGPNGMMGNPYGMNGPYGNIGGANGYPLDMYGNPIGGGMWNPGMNTWGLNGPNGMGSGYPYGGAAIGGVIGGVIGSPLAGQMGGYMGGNALGGYMGGNALGGYMGGNALGGYMGGNALGGYMGGNALGGYMGGNALGGYMGGNALGGVIGGAIGGNALGGVIGGAIGGQLGGQLGGGQYQQQLMQLQQQMLQSQMQYQQQQMQMQMQYQQQYQQVQMQRQQQLSSLYNELYSLTYRIELIKNGYGTGGNAIGGALGGALGGAISGGFGGALSGALGGAINGGFGGAVTFGAATGYVPSTGNATVTVPGRGR